ncbi:multidrug transporter EmrE-like cation transporter [Nocardioides daedukensis]|uniref:Multidrug transporter EmrE-like cation transporter n=1 Tax=Nocardioides daedukensis TaxID=634462 RepID=A0A7Y9S1L6_9ACTN|nr:hypothetical protein [Nocardioides daedukensis]NYG58074.1 multidrug transporter EmrE-like cation transporter [Nocardioides daedukensis]
MLTGLVAALASAALFGIAAVWQAEAVRALPHHGAEGPVAFLRAGARSRLMWLVVAAYLVGFVLHAVAIWLLPLYLAQATVALSMPVTAACSAYLLAEPLHLRGWTGVVAVTLGIVMLAIAAGPAGAVVTTSRYALLLWALTAVTVVLGLVSRRLGPAVLIGAVAGLGYAVSALAVRGVSSDVGLSVLASALVVPTVSLFAFWLYSLSMARTGVAPATGGLLGVQTFAPALFGILVLGDEVRDGFGWLVVVGLGVTLLGAVSLSSRATPVADARMGTA